MSENKAVAKNVKFSQNAKPFQNAKMPANDQPLLKNAKHTKYANKPFLTEVYTTSQNVTREAARRGHRVGDPLSLETGWKFLIPSRREQALQKIKTEKPYCVVLAFPCGPFSPLQRLNQKRPERLAARREEGRVLMEFALEVARLQMSAGRHCILENPRPSEEWIEPLMQKFLEEMEIYVSNFDQCQFNLRSLEGMFHKKPTRVASSSSKVCQELDGWICKRDHVHAPVIGGTRGTAHAGIYPKPLACAMVQGLEKQFESDFACREVFALDAGEDAEEELAFEGAGFSNLRGDDDGSDVDEPEE